GKTSDAQLANIEEALQTLSDRTKGIGIAPLRTVHLFQMERALGVAPNQSWPQHQGFALDPQILDTPEVTAEVIFHEMGHVLDTAGWSSISKQPQLGFGSGPFITTYAATSPAEDFAETHMTLLWLMDQGLETFLPP